MSENLAKQADCPIDKHASELAKMGLTAASTRDERFMFLALQQARRADWRTHPNPRVGAVLVKDEQVVAMGYHAAAGERHAEVDALSKVGMRAEGCELFVTLEPCNHFGRTPPCTEAIVAAGIKRCVMGSVDPDPRVSGRGIAALRSAGLEVEVGVLEQHCRQLNQPFFKRLLHRLPFLTLKLAVSMDGRIATRSGQSQWISGAAAREDVHRLRAEHDAILVGTGTLLADNPQLTARTPEPPRRQPLRVVLDRRLRVDPDAAVLDLSRAPSILVTQRGRRDDARLLHGANTALPIIEVEGDESGLHLRELFEQLAARELTTVLCEGGAGLAGALLDGGLVDRLVLYLAPILIGGRDALSPVGGLGFERLEEALRLHIESVDRLGDDLRIIAERGG
ncbi:MAG: bifunctional diaminohydroxyphosphoribosylaminopyrimidine deaminase/5-amino-6-(5-phosphoribosylamino)uracil reductase RibD [Myxococcota bacterium]|nr:bifunctional diaminohydroxyphosphoribosylaminopyrimidine deaminase/5-amino-6-(5-phosphoribosylamino)uracil reductase RibD [Myxococcota bacterium]